MDGSTNQRWIRTQSSPSCSRSFHSHHERKPHQIYLLTLDLSNHLHTSTTTFVIVPPFRYFFNVLCLDSPSFTLQPRRKQQPLFANLPFSSQRAHRPLVVTTQND